MNRTARRFLQVTAISMLVVMISGLILAVLSAGVKAESSFMFVSWADTKSDRDILSELSDQAVLFNPDFTIYPGDLESSGFTQSGMSLWKEAMDGQLTGDSASNGMFDIVFPVRGNHDDNNTSGWQAYFDFQATADLVGATNYTNMPEQEDVTYSFDFQNAHFIGVDVPGDADKITSAQIQWIDSDLAAAEARGLTHAFLYWHGPIYCVDGHCSCSQRVCSINSIVETLIEVLNNHPIVTATFHGHEHTYAYTYIDETRIPPEGSFEGVTHPFHQFVTGDAGAGPNSCKANRCDFNMPQHGFITVEVTGQDLTVTWYQQGSSVPVESRTFTKPGEIPTVADFSPTRGPEGTEVTLTGTGFSGTSQVAFNGAPAASFTEDSDTQIRANVPGGATTGPISVTTPNGTGTSADDFVVTSPPDPATLLSPSGPNTGNLPTYTWNEVSNASWYQLWVDGPGGTVHDKWYRAEDVCSGGTCAYTPDETEYTPPGTLADGPYTWWIQTWNDAGDGPWSDGMDFTVGPAVPLGAATLVSPSGPNIGNLPTYTWNVVGNASWYQLWVDDPTGNVHNEWHQAADVCSGGTCSYAPDAAEYTPPGPLADGPYTWWIRAWNRHGFGPWSAGMEFTVGPPDAPGAATLISPSGDISDDTPTYTWNVVGNASWYQLWVDGPGGTAHNEWYRATDVCAGGDCDYTPGAPLTAGPCTWWIRTWNRHGFGPWSDGMDFSVSSGATGPPDAPSTPGVSGDIYRLFLPLIVKPAGPSQPLLGTPIDDEDEGPPIDDGDEGPPLEELMLYSEPPADADGESGPPVEELGLGSGPPPGAGEEGGPPVDSR